MNRQTKRLRDNNRSLKFNHGVDFSHMGKTRHEHPEFSLVEFDKVRGVCVNSHKERNNSGRKAYNPPRIKEHSFVTALETLISRRRYA